MRLTKYWQKLTAIRRNVGDTMHIVVKYACTRPVAQSSHLQWFVNWRSWTLRKGYIEYRMVLFLYMK